MPEDILRPSFTIVIQAGGQSRRMGRDKALVPFLGEPLIQRVIRRIAPVTEEIIITTNHPESFAFLGLPLIPDQFPRRGALGGLYTALQAANAPLVGVVACDMPFVSAPLLVSARQLLFETPFAAVVPKTANGLEPFHAVYRKEICLPCIEQALEAGEWRVDSWFSGVEIRYLTESEISTLDPYRISFVNLNTPEEIGRAERLAFEIENTPHDPIHT